MVVCSICHEILDVDGIYRCTECGQLFCGECREDTSTIMEHGCVEIEWPRYEKLDYDDFYEILYKEEEVEKDDTT